MSYAHVRFKWKVLVLNLLNASCNAAKMDTMQRLLDVLAVSLIADTLCMYLPHSMHPNCKLLNFLNLRMICRAAMIPVSSQIPRRVLLLFHHARPAVRDAARKIQHSGFLLQLYRPGKRLRCLILNRQTGIPKGMSQEYWDGRQRQKKITCWTDEGRLEL